MSQAKTYQEILDEKGYLIISPSGRSMWPLIRENKDAIKLVPPGTIKKRDIILYRRRDGHYIVHRVIKVLQESVVLCGDNQWKLEKDITYPMILAVMEGYYRNEKYRSAHHAGYRLYSRIWVAFRWVRFIRDRLRNVLRKVLGRGLKDED
ncbi:MAG: S24/S26 family peptidase [Candidatus Izemoplasmatales bacterium]|nr:S24/S26 family peptidase [Candidatus Izemoplasmatales bacterium]MDD5293418.1 S24/S26 family peptidase [Candidatus Izemoplasmatales bacterium]